MEISFWEEPFTNPNVSPETVTRISRKRRLHLTPSGPGHDPKRQVHTLLYYLHLYYLYSFTSWAYAKVEDTISKYRTVEVQFPSRVQVCILFCTQGFFFC